MLKDLQKLFECKKQVKLQECAGRTILGTPARLKEESTAWSLALRKAVRNGRYAYYDVKNPDAAANPNKTIYDKYDEEATFEIIDDEMQIFTPSPLLSEIMKGGELASVKSSIVDSLNMNGKVELKQLANGNWQYVQQIAECLREDEVDPFAFQDKNQEQIIHGVTHGRWKVNAVRHDLEGAGDIFRELCKDDYSFGYISQKLRRLRRYLTDVRTGNVAEDESYKFAKMYDNDRLEALKAAWLAQPVKTEAQAVARDLNIAWVTGNFDRASMFVDKIDRMDVNESIHEKIKWLLEYAHADDEGVDLNAMYDELNAKLFNNKLPKVPVEVKQSIHTGGLALSRYASKDNDATAIPEKIVMSKGMKYQDINQLKATLAHEMAHLIDAMSQTRSDNKRMWRLGNDLGVHGKSFKDIVAAAQAKAGNEYVIPNGPSLDKTVMSRRARKVLVDAIAYKSGEIYGVFLFKHTGDMTTLKDVMYDRLTWHYTFELLRLFSGAELTDFMQKMTVARDMKSVKSVYRMTPAQMNDFVALNQGKNELMDKDAYEKGEKEFHDAYKKKLEDFRQELIKQGVTDPKQQAGMIAMKFSGSRGVIG